MATAANDAQTVSGSELMDDRMPQHEVATDGTPVESATNGGHNKFQQAISTWRNLNLSHLVSNLDKAASQIVEDQKETVAQRKDLAAKTKDFRKLDDAGKLTDIKALLKSYQNFIDLITNQSKAVNTAFLSAYTPLSDAPDPYPLLEASVESLVASEELVPRLEDEKTHLQKTITNLTTQLEDSEKQLEKERATRQSEDTNQDAKIKEIQETWNAALQEKEENWAAREQSLDEKIENQERLLKELKASYEVTQRLEQAGGDDIAAATRKAANAELEILNSELEKASLRLADVEARNEQLRVQLAESTSKHGSASKLSVEEEPAFLRLRSENTTLLRKIDAAKYEQGSEQAKLEGRIKALEQKLTSVNEDRDLLREKLDKFSDYDEVKQELEMIRAIEFATGDDDDIGEGDDTTNDGPKSSKSESLEQLLLSRNKKLNDELTSLRVSGKDIQSQLDALQESLSTTNMELEKSRNLNAQLENELLEAQQTVSNFDTMSMAGTFTSRYPKSSYATSRRTGSIGGAGGSTSPTSSIFSGFDGGRSTPSNALSPLSPQSALGGPGILPMVTAQRDRFKKKLADLETELSKSHATVTSLRGEVASLQRDNLQLYEKTRYVSAASSSYPRGGYPAPTSPGGVEVTGSNSTPSGLSLDRYRSAYEQSLGSPLAAFRGRESARVLRRMTLPERGLYALARALLATRTSRNLFALYLLGLHVLLFYALLAVQGAGHHVGNSVAGAAGAAVAAGAAGGVAKDGGRAAVAAANGEGKRAS